MKVLRFLCLEESRNRPASRGWWKPGMSKGSLKITSELRLPNASFRCCTVILQKESSRCRRISPVTGKAYDGMFRWFISEAVKLSSYSDESFFLLYRETLFLICKKLPGNARSLLLQRAAIPGVTKAVLVEIFEREGARRALVFFNGEGG